LSKTESEGLCSKALLAWYDRHRRVLPWRAPRGKRADPYHVWLSEIMLQQTTVQAVGAYFRKFLERWPTVAALAAAPQDEVLAAWAGLGYYARARNLHKAAKVVADELGGRFPDTADGLRELPGVGVYTAGAIAAIAFDRQEVAMDANAERVVARLYAIDTPLPAGKKEMILKGRALVPEKRAGDFAQAMMDLGSAICTLKRPSCGQCPLEELCAATKLGIAETLPVKGPKMVRPLRRGAAFVVRDSKGAVLLVKRPEKGLLGSMLQPPLGPWTENFPKKAEALTQAPFEAGWKKLAGVVRHGFTHFELEIEVWVAEVTKHPKSIQDCHSQPSRAPQGEGKGTQVGKSVRALTPRSPSLGTEEPGMTEMLWVATEKLSSVALPTIMRKIISHALTDEGPLFAAEKK
jgi:A/G-specific adenine glycosylase